MSTSPTAVVEDVSYDAEGCSISQASTSVLTDLLIGKKVDDAMGIHDTFLELMQGRGKVEPDEDVLEDGDRLRRRGEVPGTGEVCAAGLDGVEGRDRLRGCGTNDEVSEPMTHQRHDSDLPEVDLSTEPAPSVGTTTCSRR